MTTVMAERARYWRSVRWSLLAAALAAGCAGGEPAPPGLVAAVRDSLALAPRGFAEETRLVAHVDAQIGEVGGDSDARAELELLRLRAIERVLALPELQRYSPFSDQPGRAEPPAAIRDWVNAHEDEIDYSEPAGQWLVPSPVYWEVYERYRDTAAADEIAWAAANAGMPGECEGVIGCYLGVMAVTIVRYVEEQPAGAHAGDAVAQIVEQLRLMTESSQPGRPLCGDERTTEGVTPEQLVQLRRAVEGTPSTVASRASAVTLIGQLEARCSSGT